MSTLERSWGAFSPDIAKAYLKTHGAPSLRSRQLLLEILRDHSGGQSLSLLDLGCGNGQLYQFFRESGLRCRYTGVDFSDSLLEAARAGIPDEAPARFIKDDVATLVSVQDQFDFVLYSHVIEMLASPEQSLRRARELARRILIRFFEPPEFDVDSVELREMDVGRDRPVPYLRRKMSRNYYRLILADIGCTRVDVFQVEGDKDQVHVLHFENARR